MHILYTILFLAIGICLIIWGVLISLKEIKTWSKWYDDKWSIGNIKGLGLGFIIVGIVFISKATS